MTVANFVASNALHSSVLDGETAVSSEFICALSTTMGRLSECLSAHPLVARGLQPLDPQWTEIK